MHDLYRYQFPHIFTFKMHFKHDLIIAFICCLQILKIFSTSPDMVEPRIVSGIPVNPIFGPYSRRFAFQVSIRHRTKHICGGSIISPTKILTAAHCASPNEKPLNIKVGIYDYVDEPGQSFEVSKVTIHPGFKPSELKHDLAILTLSSPIKYNYRTRGVPLRDNPVLPDETLTVSGWGRTSFHGSGSNILNYLDVQAIRTKTCRYILRKSRYPITPSQICGLSPIGKGSGTCMGDSGGPLIDRRNRLVGVVSWGKGCGRGYPDIYTSVSYHYKWIISQI